MEPTGLPPSPERSIARRVLLPTLAIVLAVAVGVTAVVLVVSNSGRGSLRGNPSGLTCPDGRFPHRGRCPGQTLPTGPTGPTGPVPTLPASFTAPCPANLSGQIDAIEVKPTTVAPYAKPLVPVTGKWVEFKSSDGLTIPAYLSMPTSKGSFPGVVWAHGGFGNPTIPQVIDTVASSGYAVLGVDYRGSSGHGQELQSNVDIGGKEVDDVVAGAKFLKTVPKVEGNKLVVAGTSHGGAIALAAAYQNPGLFRAVGDFFGAVDWACSLVYISSTASRIASGDRIAGQIISSFGGTPDQVPDVYKERSPYYNASKLDIPVYIVQGTKDRVVPPGESMKFYKALRSDGASVDVRFYTNMPHGFIDNIKPDSGVWGDFFRFLDQNLKA